jgi:alkylhydroperoxidase/carboxymuconolactone decarboxylase family protein YurZ
VKYRPSAAVHKRRVRTPNYSRHTNAALQHGATAEQIMEAIWVAAEMRAGAASAHSALALDTIAHVQDGASERS